MYESNINNETTITAKPIFLGENQEYSTPITTTENTFNYNDGNVQDITNQYSIPQNDQNIDITHNYQSTDNYQVFQSTPMTTTENYNQFQYETQPQTIYQSTPVTTTTTTTKTNYNTLQGFTPVQESTYTQNYSTNLNNIVQQSNVIPTTTSTTQIISQPVNQVITQPITQQQIQTVTQTVAQPVNQVVTQPVNQVITQPVNQVVTQPRVTQVQPTTNQVQIQAAPANQNTSNNSHFVSNYPIYENDPRRVAFYNNKVKVYNTYRLVKPVPIEKLARLNEMNIINRMNLQNQNQIVGNNLTDQVNKIDTGLNNINQLNNVTNNIQSGINTGISNINTNLNNLGNNLQTTTNTGINNLTKYRIK